jgi:epoxyqueuosine reductase
MGHMDALGITRELKEQAAKLGFSLAGVTPASAPAGGARFDEWLAAGYAGQMHYLADRRDAYRHPRHVLDGVRSIVMLAMNYRTVEPITTPAGHGRVSRYAWGEVDYHDLLRDRLNGLADKLIEHVPAARVRGVVDTAPLMERELAQAAGLGWIGKNTLLLNRDVGSWFFLAALLTDLELEYDSPHPTDHCGTCRACLDACPTNAFPSPYVLDASRCISYLTIELREQVPTDLRSSMGNWMFGCDVCQDVCPWNSRSPTSNEVAFAPLPLHNPIDLASLFYLDDAAFRARFRNTPLWRPRRRGILRNAAIVLGNQAAMDALPAVCHGLNDSEPLIRGACAWALGKIGGERANAALQQRHPSETDAGVRGEIETALETAMTFSS